MAKVDKNMNFSELVREHPEAVEVLMNEGMYCIGCPASMFETIEQGAVAHGIDPNELISKINNKIKDKKDTSNVKDKKSSKKDDKKKENKKELSEEEIEKKWKDRMKNG